MFEKPDEKKEEGNLATGSLKRNVNTNDDPTTQPPLSILLQRNPEQTNSDTTSNTSTNENNTTQSG